MDGPFRSFAHVSIIHGLPDDDGAFKSVLERMCHWDTVATPQALAAVAHHYGRWGFARDPRAQQLLDRAAVLAQDQADDDFNVLAAAAMLWDGGDHEQGYFLTRQLADRRVADAASSMYDIHRGFRDNTPDSYLDDVVRDQWLQRAVEEGSPLAMYNMAYRNIFDDELDFSRREPGQVLRLLHGARQEPRRRAGAAAHRRAAARPRHRAGTAGRRARLSASAGGRGSRLARGARQIALAYAHGRGARKNRFAAIEWAQHASRLQPDDEGIDEIQSQVLNSHSLVKTIGTVFGAYMGRGGISAEDLPQAGRAVGMARPPVRMEAVVPAAAGRRGAGRRGTGAGHGAAVAVCGAARRAGRGRRGWPCPCPSRAGRCCACPSRHAHPAEDGLLLTLADAPALFREIERVRAQVGAPALDAVYLNSECNASIRQHRRLWGGTRNVLWLGLPLLELLSADACRAILAHECAHRRPARTLCQPGVFRAAAMAGSGAATGASQGLGARRCGSS